MNNYKLILQYDGSRYSGWQVQENSRTIQQEIINAIKIILKEEVNLIGSGRTDAGVHALGQVANFRTDRELDLYKFHFSLNSVLPKDISVTSIEKVQESFHARFDAKKRTYIYLISQFKSPFFYNYSFFYPHKIDVVRLNELSKFFIGRKNFTSFCKKKSDVENKFCDVTEIFWTNQFELFVFKISADRFLHGMVRAVVGTLLKAIKQDDSESFIQKVFESENREFAGEAVPAKGLFLYKVEY